MLNADYKDILSAFENAAVEYLLVGAYALAAHGYPRATGDIDLWIKPGRNNAQRVMQALRRFGAPLSQINREDFETPDTVFQIGVSPRRIDILTSIEGVDFESAWANRMHIELEGIAIPVLSRSHLIKNKKALGRPQDLADVQRLTDDDSEPT